VGGPDDDLAGGNTIGKNSRLAARASVNVVGSGCHAASATTACRGPIRLFISSVSCRTEMKVAPALKYERHVAP